LADTIGLSFNPLNKSPLRFKAIFKVLLIFCFVVFGGSLKSAPENCDSLEISTIRALDSINLSLHETFIISDKRPNPILQIFKNKHKKNKQITAAILAFPFPFGIVGLHRIYLGTAPHVPVVYIASLGGIFGILPFIDFCVLVYHKNIDRYIENKKVFMWVN
jgi:TM2 domain-containing membrane protein YozV